jgi:hypothetical protein
MTTQDSKDNMNILLYGSPGVGKTRFIASVSSKLYTLLLDVDDGHRTIRYLPQEMSSNVVVVRMTDFTDLDMLYKLTKKNDPAEWTAYLNKNNSGKPIKIDKPFEAIAIDTMSEMQFEMIEEIRPGGDSTVAFGDMKKLQGLQIQDWGKVIDLVRLAIRAFKDLPITFVATFHEMIIKDDLAGGIYGLPSLKGKDLPSEIGKYFDVVGHMTMTQDGKYALATKGHAKWQAKSRIPCDAIIIDPSYEKLIAKIVN